MSLAVAAHVEGRNFSLEAPAAHACACGGAVALRCTCHEFETTGVCDHVLRAAAVRLVHRLIDLEKLRAAQPDR
ncbi:MAG TPA: hypothetical protein VIL32_08865 [Steroidobacteraceae bacterium]